MPRSGVSALNWDPDFADVVEPPPLLFYGIRAPCRCGRALIDCAYTFFPSSVFVHGTCASCGPQSAIFAPHMRAVGEALPARVDRCARRLVAEVMAATGQSAEDIVLEFLATLGRMGEERRRDVGDDPDLA